MSGNGHKLLTAEREQRIMQLLHDSDVVTVSAISEALGMSEATVRRDLQAMHERGLLERVHGGAAVKQESSPEPLFSDKEEQFSTEKQRIAAAALSLIHDHDTIFLDGGSTVLVIEHNLDVIKTADYIIDLGPEGGDRGGTVVATGTPEQVAACEKSYTGKYLRDMLSRNVV